VKLHYRAFRNTDPPFVADIWRSRAGKPGLVQPISADLLEQFVFGRLHFDYAGLILAFDEDRPVGFAHASFGPDSEHRRISTETGVTCIIVVRPDCDEMAVAAGLLEQAEAYLRGHGAKVLYGGGIAPNSPFYLGLYGGCDLPGILDSDELGRKLYPAAGYQAVDRVLLFRQDLTTFRALVDRQQMQCRRRLLVQVLMDAPTRDRWEACTAGDFDWTRFELVPRGEAHAVAHALVRAVEWCDASRPGRAASLAEIFVNPDCRRQGLATHLIGEAFRTLAGQGVAYVDTQMAESQKPAIALFQKLDFQQLGEGIVYRKEIVE
jgi:GNAT superfamily N-acetyltransferase